MLQVQHNQRGHAVLSPSSASRWIACTPSSRFTEGYPDETSAAAEEGTRAHEIAEQVLRHWLEVSAIENPQMMIYALGCLDDVFVRTGRETIEEVVLYIYQPRARNRSTYHVSVEALQLWANEVLAPRADMAHRGEGTFTAGEHCRFCRAKTDCKTYTEMILSAEEQAYHEANKLSPDELGAALTRAERLAGWIDEAKERASKLISGGISVKGYKLVRGRSTRFFHNEAEAGAALRALGYGDEQLYKTSLISVAGAEKLLGKKCFSESLSHLVGTKEGSPTLASESDKRASIDLFE